MVYLDANVIIRLVEGDAQARKDLEHRLRNEPQWATSQLSRLECRSRPLGQSDTATVALFDRFFASQTIVLLDLSTAVIDTATVLRGRYGLRTPDALHLASAVEASATAVITGDRQLAKCAEIAVEVL